MSIYSSSGEVFGAKVLYGAIVALSAAILFAAVASTMPRGSGQQTAASVPQVVEKVVIASSDDLS